MRAELQLLDAPQQEQRAANADSLIDLRQLLRRCLGNVKLADRLISGFQSSLDAALDELCRVSASSDLVQTARLAHRLKGEAGNVSALEIRELAAEVEAAAQAGNLHDTLQLMKHLVEACRTVQNQIFTFPNVAPQDLKRLRPNRIRG